MYQKLVDYLTAAIISGKLSPGSRLPPLRTLCREFSLSIGTVQRGIAVLEARGLVEGRQGSGVYVRPQPRRRDTGGARITVLAESTDTEVSYCAHALRGVQEEAEARCCSLTLHFTGYSSLTPAEVGRLTESADIVLLLGGYDSVIPAFRPDLPGVGLEVHCDYRGQMSTLSLDPVRIAELAVDYFRRLGVERVQILSQLLPCHRFRGDIFELFWKRAGGSCEWILEKSMFSVDLPDRQLRPGSGLFFTGGTYQERVATGYFAAAGRHLRDDFALLSVDGKSLLIPGYQPVSTLTTDWVEAGRLAMQECLRRLSFPGSPARRLYLGVFPSYLS